MQFVGNIDKKQLAILEARKLAEDINRMVVIEKAKRKDGIHRYTTYRGWIENHVTKPIVVEFQEWKNRVYPSVDKHTDRYRSQIETSELVMYDLKGVIFNRL